MSEWTDYQIAEGGLPADFQLDKDFSDLLQNTNPLKQNRKNTLQLLDSGESRLLVKTAKVPTLRFYLRNFLPAHRMLNSFIASQQLLENKIPHAKLYACGYVKGLRYKYQAFSVQKFLSSSFSLWEMPTVNNELISQAVIFLAELHKAGFSHGDAKWANFVCKDQSFYWVDLDDVKPANLASEQQARDLSRFLIDILVKEHEDIFSEAIQIYLENSSVKDKKAFLKLVEKHFKKFAERHAYQYDRNFLLPYINRVKQ